MTTRFHRMAEDQGIPLRTLTDVAAALAHAKTQDADEAMARLMLKFGRMTDDAKAYVETYLAQS